MTPDLSDRSEVARRTVLLCVVGSTAHGLHLPGTDDRDEMGVLIEPPEYVVGLRTFEQYIFRTQPEGVRSGPGDLDLVVYSLRKWARLALAGNPTVLMLLFHPSPLAVDTVGRELQRSAPLFAARSCAKPFLGYLTAQKQRLLGERGQMRVRRDELVAAHGYDTKYAMHMLRLGLQGVELLETGRITLPMPEPHRGKLLAVRRGEVSLQDALTWAGTLERDLEDLMVDSPLPPAPDREAVDAWLVSAYQRAWSGAFWPASSTEKVGV